METSITRFHCAADNPSIGASSCIPALLTTTCRGPPSSSVAIAAAMASPSASSKATALSLPPATPLTSTTATAHELLPQDCVTSSMLIIWYSVVKPLLVNISTLNIFVV